MFLSCVIGAVFAAASQSLAGQGDKSLFERLGGEVAIRAVISDFVDMSAADPKVNFTRKGIAGAEWDATPENVQKLKDRLTEFVAQGTGGPQKYTGEAMKAVHKNMKITNAEFDAMAGHLKVALKKHNVPQKEQTELLAIVESTRKDIVGQ
jgi:hemoglobin